MPASKSRMRPASPVAAATMASPQVLKAVCCCFGGDGVPMEKNSETLRRVFMFIGVCVTFLLWRGARNEWILHGS